MFTKKSPLAIIPLFVALFAATFSSSSSSAQSETDIHNFTNTGGTTPAFPASSVAFDKAGNLYGTTGNGSGTKCGSAGCGTVYKLTPPATGGTWSGSILYNFNNNGTDGYETIAPVILDSKGNLYGTTLNGGAHGGGIVFELLPKSGAAWQERILHSFSTGSSTDGDAPYDGLIFDAKGNLYGTTSAGGTNKAGTVFELTLSGTTWKETLLYNFGATSTDANDPRSGVVIDKSGNIYGTTLGGGANGQGTVFELTPKTGGTYTETVLHSFGSPSTDGGKPYGGLFIDSKGNLYGTTSAGGAKSKGTVFELALSGKTFTESVIYSFGSGTDGQDPSYVTLVSDSSGNLYGTTSAGGTSSGGIAFELTLAGSTWTEKVLHDFGASKDGKTPAAGLVFNTTGDLFGSTVDGGAGAAGTVFEIKP